MNKGLYFYCVREKASSDFSGEGVDGEQVQTRSYRDLEAVVGEVPLAKFGSEEIQNKAEEDLPWIKEKAQTHERVIEEAMGLQSRPFPQTDDPLENKGLRAVIPMKFGIIFENKDSLEDTLEEHYSQFERDLERLKGKQEWSVKVYLDNETFQQQVKKDNPAVEEKQQEIAEQSEGRAYFSQKEVDEVVSEQADKIKEDYIESFFEDLKKHAQAGTKGEDLEKELTGKSLPMVLNMIFLVPEQELENFTNKVEQLNKEFKSKGFKFEYSGPWPPYNFIV